MDMQTKYSIKKIINARGMFTPLGVSRSSSHVANTTAEALKHYFDMDELQALAGEIIARHCGAGFATITNCASAGITLSIAAAMTGTDRQKISRLPNPGAMKNKIVIATGHLVNYGHPIEQDIRLTGCIPILAGDDTQCTIDDLQSALAQPDVAALLYVESRLTSGNAPSLRSAIAAAHSKDIPVIVDGAAQDMRMAELVASNADLLTFSAQKYLAAPTAGIVVGKRRYVEAVRAQEKGIGRPMKAGKEAILGTIAAIEERQQLDLHRWSNDKYEEAREFARHLGRLDNVTATLVKDPCKGKFWRIDMTIDEASAGITATDTARKLQQGSPAIYCCEGRSNEGVLNFEILELDSSERRAIIERITKLLHHGENTRS